MDWLRQRINSSGYLKDITLQVSGNTAAQILSIAAMPVLTRLYSPAELAVQNIFLQAVSAFAIIMTLRLEYLVLIPEGRQDAYRIVQIIFIIGGCHVLIWTPILFHFSSGFDWLKGQEGVARWIWLAPISAWGVSLAVGLQQVIQRASDFKSSAVAEFIGRCAYVLSAFLGVLALPSTIGLMASTAVGAVAKLFYLVLSIDYQGLVRWAAGGMVRPSIWRMAISTSFSSMVSLFAGAAPMIYISSSYGADALGSYGLVISTLYLPSTLLGQAVGQVYYQRAAKLYSEGRSFSHILRETSVSLVKIGVPMYLLIAVFSPFAYPAIFGASWGGAGDMAPWLCFAACCGFLSSPVDKTSIVVNAWWYLTAWHMARAATTALVIYFCYKVQSSLIEFVSFIACQMALAYIADWCASYKFAKYYRGRGRELSP